MVPETQAGARSPGEVEAGENPSMAELASRCLNGVRLLGEAVPGDWPELPGPEEVAHPLGVPSPRPQTRSQGKARPLSLAHYDPCSLPNKPIVFPLPPVNH